MRFAKKSAIINLKTLVGLPSIWGKWVKKESYIVQKISAIYDMVAAYL